MCFYNMGVTYYLPAKSLKSREEVSCQNGVKAYNTHNNSGLRVFAKNRHLPPSTKQPGIMIGAAAQHITSAKGLWRTTLKDHSVVVKAAIRINCKVA